MDFLLILSAMVGILLFVSLLLFIIWYIVITINSGFFKISPTITSSKKSTKIIIEYLKEYIQKNNLQSPRILDIGSGYGTLFFRINKAIKNLNFVGYEISKLSYKISNLFNKYDNIKFYNDDIFNLKDFNFNIIITFLFLKQQNKIISLYNKFPIDTIIISNSFKIPFTENDNYMLLDTKHVCYRWDIFIYKKVK